MSETIINQAIREEKGLKFNYTKYSGETSKRKLSNIGYCNEYGEYGYYNEHIRGFCHLRKEDRTFKISRMSNIQLYSQTMSEQLEYEQNKNRKPYSSSLPKSFQPPTRTDYRDYYQYNKNTQPSKSNEGCYIATMVYGSYEDPSVMVLRKFRDNKLRKNILGRCFVRIYYSLSPFFVKIFKNNKTVNLNIKHLLDKIIIVINKAK